MNNPYNEPLNDDQLEQKFGSFMRDRITELRLKKDKSENQMSLELGKARSYINTIVSGRAWPSMEQFFQICSYFEVTPEQFFDAEVKNPSRIKELNGMIKYLDKEQFDLVVQLVQIFLRDRRESE